MPGLDFGLLSISQHMIPQNTMAIFLREKFRQGKVKTQGEEILKLKIFFPTSFQISGRILPFIDIIHF